jgi:hypothetical protein
MTNQWTSADRTKIAILVLIALLISAFLGLYRSNSEDARTLQYIEASCGKYYTEDSPYYSDCVSTIRGRHGV